MNVAPTSLQFQISNVDVGQALDDILDVTEKTTSVPFSLTFQQESRRAFGRLAANLTLSGSVELRRSAVGAAGGKAFRSLTGVERADASKQVLLAEIDALFAALKTKIEGSTP